MKIPSVPENEEARLEKLESYQILDTLPERDFDDLTALAAFICNSPIALISLVDEKRQWFKSPFGLNAKETSREISFCGHVVAEEEMLIVPDATQDHRFFDNPLVTGDPNIRFYAGAPLVAPGSLFLGTLCVIDDKTRQISEEQITMLNALARQVVSQFELRLNIEKLKRVQQELEASAQSERDSNRAKTLFLANMTHEIRTPLNGVTGMVELLANTPVSARQKEYLDLAMISANALHSLISDTLEISRIEAEQLDIVLTPFSLPNVITNVIQPMTAVAEAKGLNLVMQVDPEIPDQLIGDPSRLIQILNNLLGNGIKFTTEGEVKLEAKFAGKRDGLVSVCIVVSDTGIGIPPDKLESIFGVFSQLNTSTTRKNSGAGLGLAIVKKLTRRMGGEVQVKSELGEGASFILDLQFQEPSPSETTVEVFESSPPTIEANSESCAKQILVVEDNQINQTVVVEMLRDRNHQANVAENGREALEKVNQQSFDLILMDMQMPSMDGIEATQLIRSREQSEGLPRVPIIGLSANALSDDRRGCLSAGMDEYLTKPIQKDMLLGTIDRFLGR